MQTPDHTQVYIDGDVRDPLDDGKNLIRSNLQRLPSSVFTNIGTVNDWFRPRFQNLTGPILVCAPKTCNMTAFGLE